MAEKLTQEEIDRINEDALSDAQSEFDAKYHEFFEPAGVHNGEHRPVVMEELIHWAKGQTEDYRKGRIDQIFEPIDFLFEYRIEGDLLVKALLVPTELEVPELDENGDEMISSLDTWETAKTLDLHSAFFEMLCAAARSAKDVQSDTYAVWREAMIFFGPYSTLDNENEIEIRLKRIRKAHEQLWADLLVSRPVEKPSPACKLGPWARRFVSEYDPNHGTVDLVSGKCLQISSKSRKAWEILTLLFTSEEPEGWAKLPCNWKSQFVRKIGSTGEVDRESDIVKIATFITPHTPRKGRAGDGLYRFEQPRLRKFKKPR